MAGWIDSGNAVQAAVVALARELSDPVRLTSLQLLAAEGPHTMVQLADAMGVSAPRLGNHLARLRAAGLVTVEHTGRHAVYRVARGDITDVLTALARYAHQGELTAPPRESSPVDVAHTCYDHAAGRLGISVFAALVDGGALRPPDGRTGELALGADLTPLHRLGVDPGAADPRRRLALACLDRTHRVPHLGGDLGRLVLDAFVADDLVRRQEGTRELLLTGRGAERLPELLPTFVPA
ncbi:metalloregulator ArsR/SmtB family transcription factor [Actinosynnema sp. NPDC023658]|uniref:ArsR/SmtB family transcription factor n=1 Tax=Actinosynnema sp. NPDC023658 TaxID=3155465 RepID=UPI0034094174